MKKLVPIPLTNDSELRESVFKKVLDAHSYGNQKGDLEAHLKALDKVTDAIMQIFASQLQLAVLEGRKEELVKNRRFVEKMAEYADDPEAMEEYDSRITALNKQIEGLK